MLTAVQTKNVTETLKILAHPTRLKIVSVLLGVDSDMTICVGEIAQAINMSHSATSHQLARLEDKGVVRAERKGQTMCYSLNTNKTTHHLKRIITDFS